MHRHFVLPKAENLNIILQTPNIAYLDPTKKELYVSTPDGIIHMFVGPNFDSMTDDEIKQYVLANANNSN